MKRTLMMAAAVAAFAGPVLAQDPVRARDEQGDQSTEARLERRAERRAERQQMRETQAEQPAPVSEAAPPRRERQESERQAVERQAVPVQDVPSPQQRRARRAERDDSGEAPALRAEDRQDRGDPRPEFRQQTRVDADAPPAVVAPNPEPRHDRTDQRSDRRHDRGAYRDFHNRWDREQWRRDWNRRHRSDWWRYDRGFRNYDGFRFGFYFAPGYGYYTVPRQYFGRHWYVGQYLPSIFWRYQMTDWRTFGLGYPPPGTQWVYVDNAIYLIDRRDGYIIEVITDAWRW